MSQIQPNQYNQFDNEEEINIKEIVRILLQGKWILIVSFLLVVTATAFYTFTTDPIYESSSLLLIENSGDAATGMFDLMSPFGSTQMMINNELEIVKSRSLAERTIKALKEKYGKDSLYVLGGTMANQNKKSLYQSVKEWILLLGNQVVEEEIEPSEEEINRNYARNLMETISVSTIRETQALRITYQSKSAGEAALVINTMASEYYDLDLERSRGAMGEVKDFLSSQLGEIEDKLMASEDSLQVFQQKEGVVNLDAASQELITQLSDFESIYYTALAETQVYEQQIFHLKEQLNAKENELLNTVIQTANPLILMMQNRIAELQSQSVDILTKGFDKTSFEYTTVENQITAFKKRLNSETRKLIELGYIPGPNDPMGVNQILLEDIVKFQTELISTQAQGTEYKKLVDYYNKELEKLPRKIISYARLERDRQVNEKIYLLMKQKYEESRITEASQIGNVYVIDKAIPAKYPIKPKKKMNLLLGGFLGLGLGVGIIFIREFLDNTVKSKEDMTKAGYTVLAMIPRIDNDELNKKLNDQKSFDSIDGFQNRLIINLDSKSPVSEAYRSLRTNIELSNTMHSVDSMVITSSGPGEGKSTTLANLALAFANKQYKTVLIDADLRKPIVHKLFGVKRVPGLVDVILGRAELDEVIHKTSVENMYVIPAGNIPPNPSETLGSKKMKEIHVELKKRFEKVFYDAPPIIAVTDAAVIGSFVDSLIYVVNSGKTYKELVQHSKSLFDQGNLPLLGAIVNNVDPKNMTGSYYYYHKYYHYKY